jgi:hypothetical protein
MGYYNSKEQELRLLFDKDGMPRNFGVGSYAYDPGPGHRTLSVSAVTMGGAVIDGGDLVLVPSSVHGLVRSAPELFKELNGLLPYLPKEQKIRVGALLSRAAAGFPPKFFAMQDSLQKEVV